MNQHIVDVLKQLLRQYSVQSGKTFQIKAINKCLDNIAAHPSTITSGVYAKKNITGVGKGLAKRIDEIITTGTLREIVTDEDSQILNEFCAITGIGPKKARTLLDDGYRSIRDLREGVLTGNVKITHHIGVGLRYHDDFQERIPRDEITQLGMVLAEAMKKVDGGIVHEICGSYRRGASTCGDMDVLMSHPGVTDNIAEQKFMGRLVKLLTDIGFLVDHLTTKGGKKYMGVCSLGRGCKARRIDIRCVDWCAYYPALIYFTGSKNFNIMLRRKAQELGYSLSEYGFKVVATNELITVNSEQDLFTMLDEPYVPPTSREMGK